MKRPPLAVFDLDDTLYLERDFARSGYAAAAKIMWALKGIDGFGELCLHLLDGGRRAGIFDEALALLGLEPERRLIDRLVDEYRNHVPDISLAPDVKRYLRKRRKPFRGALVTDGLASTQEAKVKALDLASFLECIVCTGRLGPGFGKPHARPFELVEAWAQSYGAPLLYVADNPLKDFVTPNRRGWRTIQIQRPQRVHHVEAPDERHQAHASITSFDELDDCVEHLF